MDTSRRNLLSIGAALLCGMAGCLSLSEKNNRNKSTLEITNQRGAKLEGVIRFIDGENVVVEEPLNLSSGNNQFEVEFPQDVRQVTLVIDLHRPAEQTYEESVPAGVPEYYITIQSDGIDVTWAEN